MKLKKIYFKKTPCITLILLSACKHCNVYIQYMYIVGKYKMYLYKLQKQAEWRTFQACFAASTNEFNI